MRILKERAKIILLMVAVVAAILAMMWIFREPESAVAPTEGIVYYYGNKCPHCQNVSKFIEENGIENKVTFEKKEFSSPSVTKEFLDRASQCGISHSQAGVPLVYFEGKCYMGDADSIAFFKEKAGI